MFFKKKSPSGLEYFSDPETSSYKEWFNKHHTISMDASKQAYCKAAFDLSVYWVAKFEPIDNPSDGKLNKNQKKIRNEISSYEASCWYIAYLDDWLVDKNHKDREIITATFIKSFALIPLNEFKMNIEQLEEQMLTRINYYRNLGDVNDVIATICSQICSGFKTGNPAKSIPPENYNMLDFNRALIAPMLMQWMTRIPTFEDSWEKLLLSPAFMK